MTVGNAQTRFSNRVQDYIRYRPDYPQAVMDCLRDEFGLRPPQVVADIGSGTGISAGLLLDNGHRVIAVEPNAEMLAAAEARYGSNEAFQSVAAPAEATTLPDASVDWIVAAQAFHWFDVEKCRVEFRRILKRGGFVALLWNDRRDDTLFLKGYDALLKEYAIDYEAIDHRHAESDGRIERLFAPHAPVRRVFPNHQDFDFDGLRGRVLSSSYMPTAEHPRFNEMIQALRDLYDRHQTGDRVRFAYDTKLFVGPAGD